MQDTETPKLKQRLFWSVGFLIALMYVSMGHTMWEWPLPKYFEGNPISVALVQLLLAVAVMIINGKFFKNGFKAILNRSPNMDTLVALVGSPAIESAYANDRAPDLCFAQQVFGLGNLNDVLIGISTSGNSKNVLYASEVAKAKGMTVIGMTGMTGGKMNGVCDICLKAPETEPYKIQERHLPIYHTICLCLENEIFGE